MENRTGTLLAQDSLPGQRVDVTVERVSHHGWADCFQIQNGCIEAIVVSAIGRVMQLCLAGDADGAFWENRTLDGQLHPSNSSEPHRGQWMNFGGDKCWPAPQSDWQGLQGRDWPPPAGFDSRPMEAVATGSGVVLTSRVDSVYGIEVVRHVELEAGRPVLRIRSEFRKLTGSPVRVGVWSITQMQAPERVFMLLRKDSTFAGGYLRLLEAEPAGLEIEGGLLSFARHPRQFTKLGSDGSSLVWVGRTCVVRIDAEQGPGEYPDGGCVTEIYTNPDPHKYVELEALGPLQTMDAGDRIERSTVYTVLPRSMAEPEDEARKALGL